MKNGSNFNGTGFLNIEHLKYLYLSSEGRINRQRIWLGGLLLGVALILIFVVGLISFLLLASFSTYLAGLIFIVAYAASVIASIMMLIKRAHDRNHSSWYILLTLIPLIGIIVEIELYFFKGTDGPNQYGADPR